MRLNAFVLLLMAAAACGPGRDPTFHPILLLSAVPKIEVSGNFVYWAESNGLKRVKKTGGTPDIILSGGVIDFAAAPGHVYAATNTGLIHFDVPADGVMSTPTPISSDVARAVAADASGVSWVTCETLTHAAHDGSAQRSTLMQAGACGTAPLLLTLDSSTAYGVTAKGLWYASRSGTNVMPFSATLCQSIGAASGWLYCGGESLGLQRIDPLTRNTEVVFMGKVRAFDFSESRIYAAVGEDLVSSPRNSNRVEVLGTYAAVSAISVDSSGVYFVNTEGDRGLMLSTAL